MPINNSSEPLSISKLSRWILFLSFLLFMQHLTDYVLECNYTNRQFAVFNHNLSGLVCCFACWFMPIWTVTSQQECIHRERIFPAEFFLQWYMTFLQHFVCSKSVGVKNQCILRDIPVHWCMQTMHPHDSFKYSWHHWGKHLKFLESVETKENALITTFTSPRVVINHVNLDIKLLNKSYIDSQIRKDASTLKPLVS